MNNNTEKGNALICIPDITGFTRFMVENDIGFSKKIIPPLLRTIINSNTLNLNVSEIEGDAIVFYKFGILPTLNEITQQCLSFHTNFNEQLKQLMDKHADDFTKYTSSNKLSLKVIVHMADIRSTHIEGITKLIGEDMVVAHKLLKNSIQVPEYILLTQKLISNYTNEEIENILSRYKVSSGKDEYEYIGTINYNYITLQS